MKDLRDLKDFDDTEDCSDEACAGECSGARGRRPAGGRRGRRRRGFRLSYACHPTARMSVRACVAWLFSSSLLSLQVLGPGALS